jgi:NitT/TauT family transport system substrate-binding protein
MRLFRRARVGRHFEELAGRELIAGLISGQLEAGSGSVSAGLFNAARDVPIKIVAPQARMDLGASSLFLLVRRDLIASGQFQGYADLLARRVAFPNNSATGQRLLALAMARGGLDAGSLQTVLLDFAGMTAAFASNAIDAAFQAEPTATLSVDSGVAVKWREVSDLPPGLQNTVVLFGPDFVAQRPQVATAWVTAYLKGVRDYYAAILQHGPDRAAVAAVLTRWTAVAQVPP